MADLSLPAHLKISRTGREWFPRLNPPPSWGKDRPASGVGKGGNIPRLARSARLSFFTKVENLP
jgi:hypothetical protein